MALTFTCDHCGETSEVDPNWTEQDRIVEALVNDHLPASQVDETTLCDPCYRDFLAWLTDKRRHDPNF